MADTVTIVVEGKDNATPVLKNVSRELGNVSDSTKKLSDNTLKNKMTVTDWSSALVIAEKVLGTVKKVVMDSYNAFATYAEQVRDLSLISKTGAEETSRFLQVLDDYQLTAEDAEVATKKLKDNGLVPTVETLAMLADQYKKIKDPAEAFKFIQDNLGKGGVKWINVLNQESDALREQAAQVNKNLILSEQQIKDAEKERLAIDALADSWQGLKVQTGAFFGQQILNWEQNKNNIVAWNDEMTRAAKTLGVTEDAYRAMGDAGIEAQVVIEMIDWAAGEKSAANYFATLDSGAEVLIATAEEIEELSKVNTNYLSTIGSVTKSIDDYKNKEQDLQQTHDELLAKKKELLAQGWWAESDAVQEVNAKLAENAEAYAKNATEFELASRTRILSMLQEQLAAEGLSVAETTYLLDLGLKWGVYSSDAVTAAKAAQDEVARLTDQFNGLPTEKNISINVNTNYTASGQTSAHEQNNNKGPLSGGFAEGTGGWKTVPPGYPNDSYPIMAQSGEKFAVIPTGKTQGYGNGTGSGVNVTVNYSTMMSLASASDMKRTLLPVILQGIEEAQAQGRVK
jgi:hypothetical protein